MHAVVVTWATSLTTDRPPAVSAGVSTLLPCASPEQLGNREGFGEMFFTTPSVPAKATRPALGLAQRGLKVSALYNSKL